MQRHLFIHLEKSGDSIIIPELVSAVNISHGSPPQVHNIVSLGPRTALSYPGVKVVSMENTQFWEHWIERFIEGGLSPRGYADKLAEWRDSLELVLFAVVLIYRFIFHLKSSFRF